MPTIQQIKNAKSAEKRRELHDFDGLYLVVTQAGARKRWPNALELYEPSATKGAKNEQQQTRNSTTPIFP